MLNASTVSAQGFGDFLKSLKSGLSTQPATEDTGQATGSSKSANKQGQTSFGAKATENYCKNLFSVAAIDVRGPVNEALVSEEFNMDSKDFYDAVVAARDAKPGFVSYTFPKSDFYQGEFETDKVDVLFDLLLSYPTPKYAAALIAEARTTNGQPQYDHQAKVDAIVALAILHYRMQDKSKTPERWKELVASVRGEENYAAKVVWARLLKSGEMGEINPSKAITLLVEANGLRAKYMESGYKTMSTRNYQVTSHQTLYETLIANPTNSQRRYFDQFLQKYEALQKSADPVPELRAQLEPGLNSIAKASNSASKKATQALSGATQAGKIKAEKASMDSATRTRVSDTSGVNADARTLAAIARELEKGKTLDDAQKAMFADALKDAHESGDRAVSMMMPMMSAVMNVIQRRGMEALPAIVPYARKLQSYSDNACTVISRMDHAAIVMGVPATQESGAVTALMNPK
jgi:hypothetical protein